MDDKNSQNLNGSRRPIQYRRINRKCCIGKATKNRQAEMITKLDENLFSLSSKLDDIIYDHVALYDIAHHKLPTIFNNFLVPIPINCTPT